MNFSKIRNVKSPSRANPTDAGIDMFVPELSVDFLKDFKDLNNDSETFVTTDGILAVVPNGRIRIPAGTKWDIPAGFAMMGFNKSGVSYKKGLNLMSQVIDSGYQGELILNFRNLNDYIVEIAPNEKIVQFILMPIGITELIETPLKDLYKEESSRSDGGFGSSGV